ncbi:MAG: hypothetical protein WAM43_16160 [Terriglobales bacterium]
MNTNKVAYWVALGVLALGLNSEYRHGNFVALHQAVERADFAMCGVTTRAERTLAAAIGGTGRSQFVAEAQSESASRLAEVRLQSNLLREQAREQAEFARDQIRAQAEVIRSQAEMQRAAIEQVRSRAESQFRLIDAGDGRMTVFCPKTRARVIVRRSDVSDDSPEIEVSDSF